MAGVLGRIVCRLRLSVLRLSASPNLEQSARDLALRSEFVDLHPRRFPPSIRRTGHPAPLGSSRPMVIASRAHEEPGKTAGKPAEGDPRLDEVKENTSLGIPPPVTSRGMVTKVRE